MKRYIVVYCKYNDKPDANDDKEKSITAHKYKKLNDLSIFSKKCIGEGLFFLMKNKKDILIESKKQIYLGRKNIDLCHI